MLTNPTKSQVGLFAVILRRESAVASPCVKAGNCSTVIARVHVLAHVTVWTGVLVFTRRHVFLCRHVMYQHIGMCSCVK